MLDELFTFWNLDETDDTLEELEDLLIVLPPQLLTCLEALCTCRCPVVIRSQ